MPDSIVSLNEESLRADLRELVRMYSSMAKPTFR